MLRTPNVLNWFRSSWRAPVIGMTLGLLYGSLEHVVDLEAMQSPRIFMVLDDVVVFCLPIALGGLAGLLVNYVRWQHRVNRALSTENAKFQRYVFTQALTSHVLHDIRNPLHNLTAVIERWQPNLPPQEVAILQRNLDRLQAVMKQLRGWNVLEETIDLREAVALRPWLKDFIHDKVQPQLRDAGITLHQQVEPVIVFIHPLLLEQCLVTFFNNAVEAITNVSRARTISVSAQLSRTRQGHVEMRLRNTGEPYRAPVLATQGREPVKSEHGLGLGLVLVQRTLEQIGGSLSLTNDGGQATTICSIPGRAE